MSCSSMQLWLPFYACYMQCLIGVKKSCGGGRGGKMWNILYAVYVLMEWWKKNGKQKTSEKMQKVN